MPTLYQIKHAILNWFRSKDSQDQRQSPREPTIIYVSFVSTDNADFVGNGEVMDINKSGLSLDLDKNVPSDIDLALKINPHIVQQYINLDEITQDSQGSFLVRVVWSRPKAEGEGCYCGANFIALSDEPYKV